MTRQTIVDNLKLMLDKEQKEGLFQEYLERHTWMLVHTTFLDPPLLISKLPLGSDYVTDFAFFWRNSGGDYLTLVEIEPPIIDVFTSVDDFSSQFNHAVEQVAGWEDWCQRNKDDIAQKLEPLFDLGLTTCTPSFTRVQTLLVVGRRAAFAQNTRRRRKWETKVNEVRPRSIRTWEGFIESIPAVVLTEDDSTDAPPCMRYRKQTYERVGSEANA